MGWGKRLKNKFSLSFLLSISFHVFFLSFFTAKHFNSIPSKESSLLSQDDKKIDFIKLDSIEFISKDQVQKIKEEKMKQVVASENRGVEIAPVNSRFFGEKNNTTERQTITKNHGSFKEAGVGDKTANSLSKSPESTRLKEETPKLKKVAKKLNLSDLGGFTYADAERSETVKYEEEVKKVAQKAQARASGLENGNQDKLGLAANNDHVEDVALGEMTNLNTQEFKYYGFYQRIRIQLEQHWGSSIKEKAKNLYRSGRRIPASDNLITSVNVILDSKGQIVEMTIQGTSGVRELDQAAIESFNKAGPFPNPPKGLLVDGRATIQWGFVVKS